MGALAPVLIVLEVGFRDETYARRGAAVDIGAVVAHAVGGPVGHAVVHVLAVVDAHGGDAVLANADVGARIEATTADAAFNSEVKELLRPSLPGRPLAEIGHLVAVPLASALLGADVEVGAVGLQGVNLVGREQSTTVACGQGRKDFAGAEVLSYDPKALQAKVKDVADHGDRCVVDAVHAGGPPRLEPGVVGDVVAKHAFVLRGHVRRGVDQGHVANKGGWQAVGGVVGRAPSGDSVKVDEHATLEGEDEMIVVGGHAQDVGRGRVASVGAVVGLDAVATGVHLFNDGRTFHGEQERGCSLRGRCSDGVHHVVHDRPRREPNRVADVVAHDKHGVVR